MILARVLFAVLAAAAADRAQGQELPVAFIESGREFAVFAEGLSARFSPGRVTFSAGVAMEWDGVSAEARPEGIERLRTRVNFISGNGAGTWRTGLATYRGVLYRNLYPGIDLTWGNSGRKLKSEFVVAPGADPSVIRMRYAGAKSVSIETDGSLTIVTRAGEMKEAPPFLYQKGRGTPVSVVGRFVMAGPNEVAFEIGDYDDTDTLYIDPVLSASTYFGGSRNDAVTAVTVDSQGDVYVAGWAESANLPSSRNFPYSGSVDAWVASFEPGGRALRWVTYFGGSGEDRALGVAVDFSGSPWITGFTTSRNLPLASPFQNQRRGTRDAFVAQFDSQGSFLKFASYLGGTGVDSGNAIRIDQGGLAVVGGETTSPNFPVSPAPYQRLHGGQRDGFVMRLYSGGIISATFLGGSGDDRVTSLAVAGPAILAGGCTGSPNFPVKAASQSAFAGGQDGFIVSLNTPGTDAAYATYLGGSAGSPSMPECVNGIAADSAGNAYVTGSTPSTNFPVGGAFQSAHAGGGLDAFVTKLTPAGARVYSSFLGGRGPDVGYGIAVDGAQRPWITGYSGSGNFPVTSGASQTGFGGLYDAFLARIESSGATIGFASYFGGSASDTGLAVACNAAGDAVAGGSTTSNNFPVTNAFQGQIRGGVDGFLLKVSGP